MAKRKLTLILRSKTIEETPIAVGDMVQIFVKDSKEKRGKWSQSMPVLSYDLSNRTVTVPGSKGRKVCAAVEDVRPSICANELASAVQDSIDELDRILDEVVDQLESEGHSSDETVSGHRDRTRAYRDEEPDCIGQNLPAVGDRIEVYWPLDKKFYEGCIEKHDVDTDKYSVHYIDGDKENVRLQDEVWNYVKDTTNHQRLDNTETEERDEDRIQAGEVQLSPGQELQSAEEKLIESYYQAFGHGEFMLHQAQGLPPYATQIAYAREEQPFKKIAHEVAVSQIPKKANVVTSQVLYKVKRCDDGSLTLKARIAVHGNKGREKNTLKTDSATCPPVGIRILLSLATIFSWTLSKIDFKSAFLQTQAKRDVYVVPPRECKTRYRHYWLLLSAAYGLVNAGAKWQQLSDDVLRGFGFLQSVQVPQLFYLKANGKLVVAAVKVVDDIMFAGKRAKLSEVIGEIAKSYKLGTIVYGPGQIHFYSLMVTQLEDMMVTIDGEEKCEVTSHQVLRDGEEESRNLSLTVLSSRRSGQSTVVLVGWVLPRLLFARLQQVFCNRKDLHRALRT